MPPKKKKGKKKKKKKDGTNAEDFQVTHNMSTVLYSRLVKETSAGLPATIRVSDFMDHWTSNVSVLL